MSHQGRIRVDYLAQGGNRLECQNEIFFSLARKYMRNIN